MRNFLLFFGMILIFSANIMAQTPQLKWTSASTDTVQWLQLDGKWYRYNTGLDPNFKLYAGLSDSPLFSVNTGNARYVYVIPDVTGDEKEDIMVAKYLGTYDYMIFLINGQNGNVIYKWEAKNSVGDGIIVGDVDNDGSNEVVMLNTNTSGWTVYSTNGIATKITQDGKSIPVSFSFGQNYPNPFNPSTTINNNLSS